MDPTFPMVIFCFVLLIDMPVCATPGGYIGWPHDGAGSWWHVFRQVHASEVASRQALSASRNPSSKVAETMKIIPKEERRSEPSFTIISRIKSPLDHLMTMLPQRPSWTSGFLGRRAETVQKDESTSRTASFHGPWPSHNGSNFLIIGEAEPVVEDHQRGHVETSRQNDGFFTVEKGLVRYRGSQEAAGGSGRYPQQSSTFGLWEMLKLRRPQKWDVLNKLLTQSTTEIPSTSTTPLSRNANESSRPLENDDSVLVNSPAAEDSTTMATMTTSQQQPDTITNRNQNQSESEGSSLISSPVQPDKAHQLDSWLVVRIDDSTCYAATSSFDNGTIVFQRFGTDGLNQSGWRNLSYVEAYYPGFGQAAGGKPSRLIVQSIVTAALDETMNNIEQEPQTPQTVVIGNQTVLIPSTSPWVGNETVVFDNDINTSDQNVAIQDESLQIENKTEIVIAEEEPFQTKFILKNETSQIVEEESVQSINDSTISNQNVTMEEALNGETISSQNLTIESVQQSLNETTISNLKVNMEEAPTLNDETTSIQNVTMEEMSVQSLDETTISNPNVNMEEAPTLNVKTTSIQNVTMEEMSVQSLNETTISNQNENMEEAPTLNVETTSIQTVTMEEEPVQSLNGTTTSDQSVEMEKESVQSPNNTEIVVLLEESAQIQNDTDILNQEITTEEAPVVQIENDAKTVEKEFVFGQNDTEMTNQNNTTTVLEEEPVQLRNDTLTSSSQNVTVEEGTTANQKDVEPLNPVFRKVEDEKPVENSVDEPNEEFDSLQLAVNLAVPIVVSNVTAVPSSSTEEQMAPPLLKTLENLLLTHLFPPTSSMSSSPSSTSPTPSTSTNPTTTTPSTTTETTTSSNTTPSSTPMSLHHLPFSDSAEPISDWAIAVSQLLQKQQPARLPLTSSPPSTTALPEAILQSPAYYDPTINAGTLSSHSVIIPSRNQINSMLQLAPSYPLRTGLVRPESAENVFTTDQLSLMAVSEKPPISATPTTLPTIFPSPAIQMFTLRPESSVSRLGGHHSVASQPPPPPPKKKSGGLASLILAHTSSLMSGKNSPFFNAHRYNPPSNNNHQYDNNNISRSEDLYRQTKKNPALEPIPMVASVHVIVATPFPDPEQEEEMRHRSLDSGVRRNKEPAAKIGNSTSWNFPSFSQLIESPELLLPGSTELSVPTEDSPVTPISSYHDEPAGELPRLPRFTCGQQTTADELVLTNPSYPNPDDHAGRCGFRLLVTSNHVCQVRIQFRDSRMLLPRQGSCVDQFMTVTESTAGHPSIAEDKFCGWNSDQHFYLELTESGASPRHVDFKINTKSSSFLYRYSLIIQQIDCQLQPNPVKAPSGCYQYFNSQTGVIKSFNYDGGQYWNKQSYRICVRSIDQACTLALSSPDGNFGLQKSSSRHFPTDRSGVGIKACPRDYLWIPGSIQSEGTTESSNIQDRYCGAKFSDRHGDLQSRIVLARMYSSVHIMEFRAGVPRNYDDQQHGPGFRIDFQQMNECPSQPNKSKTPDDETDPGIEDEDYYDEVDEHEEDLFNGNLRRLH